MEFKSLFYTVFLSFSLSAQAVESIRIQSTSTNDAVGLSYYEELLTLILTQTESIYGVAQIEDTNTDVSEERAFLLLKMGMLDVFWAATNVKRESQFLAIKIPILRGLLGVRVPVIRIEDKPLFDKITHETQLKHLLACQGEQWTDTEILRFNGYRVEGVTKLSSLYPMLKLKRCDYFPRGLNEVYGELKDKQGFLAYDRLLLRYPNPMYFFVAKDNIELYNRINDGLSLIAVNGQLQDFIMKQPMSANIFPLERFGKSVHFKLQNPFLPYVTPLDRKELWLSIPESQFDTEHE